MPVYEYQCDGCQKILEVMQKFSDAPLAECPECGSPVKKLMSLTSFALKGTGWYTTDYKRAGGAAPKREGASGDESAKPAEKAAATPAPAAPASASSSSSSTSGTGSGSST